MNKTSFCSRIYVYVSHDPDRTDSSCLVSIENANGTNIGGGYLDSQTQVADCLSAMGCSEERLPRDSYGQDMVRVLSNVRPRDLDAALALLD